MDSRAIIAAIEADGCTLRSIKRAAGVRLR
jgi:hypothetical protein